jgi:alkyl hydroperoxide reductase subunit AhpC
LPELQKKLTGTLLEKVAAAAARDVDLQSGRHNAVSQLSNKFTGRKVKKFSISGLGGDALSSEDLKGHVTVLHFWEYRDEPLKEPYGQVGYLDFLYQRRKSDNVRVYGVAVDGRLADEKTRPAAERSVKKLKAFMNLSYPVLLDNGSLVKKFGDPRPLGATLPLFVVVGPDGTIVHYHVGHHKVHQEQGLEELDRAVGEALSKK